MPVAPLLVLALVALAFAWLLRTARVTAGDVTDVAKGAHPGAHLPSVNPDIRDVAAPRSLVLDADTERFRNALPGGGASG
jgi:hypothetical protein